MPLTKISTFRFQGNNNIQEALADRITNKIGTTTVAHLKGIEHLLKNLTLLKNKLALDQETAEEQKIR